MRSGELGGSGIKASVLGLGGNTFGPRRLDRDVSIKVIPAALASDVTLVDTAIFYGCRQSESLIGEALRGRRDQAIIATKFNLQKLGSDEEPRRRIRAHREESLRNLKTDSIDLFQVHLPSDEIETDELIEILCSLIDAGRIRACGVSNYSSWRVAESFAAARRLQGTRRRCDDP